MSPEKPGGIVFGCVVPHPPLLVPVVGRGQESRIAATAGAMNRLARDLGESKPDSLAIISPHGDVHSQAMGVYTRSHSAGDMMMWGDPSPVVTFASDQALAQAILEECSLAKIPAGPIGEEGYKLDHGVMVPMHFVSSVAIGLPLLPLSFSFLPLETHYYFGQAIAAAAVKLKRRLALIASGDLSHRLIPEAPAGYDPQGKVFDQKIVDAVSRLDARAILELDPGLIDRAGECGLRSITILLGALHGLSLRPKILSYEGPFGVGYLVAAFSPELAESRHPLVELARQAVEARISGKRLPHPEATMPEMQGRAGVFVCLKKQGCLRGCVGTFEPTRGNVAEEVVANAVSSATQDPRFTPVDPSELPDLEYTVDVLTDPEPVSGPEELDSKRYGVIVESGMRRGLLLPDLEGVETVEKQLEISRQKAGIAPDEPVQLYRFEVKRYK